MNPEPVPGRLPGGQVPADYRCHWLTGGRSCDGADGFTIVQYIISNGKSKARHLCLKCRKLMMFDLPYTDQEAKQFPLARDRRQRNPMCERCGTAGTEYHHWAPRAVFLDADEWPTAWLCPRCHSEWHQVMRIAGAPTRSAGAA